jgi:hypothetical protein
MERKAPALPPSRETLLTRRSMRTVMRGDHWGVDGSCECRPLSVSGGVGILGTPLGTAHRRLSQQVELVGRCGAHVCCGCVAARHASPVRVIVRVRSYASSACSATIRGPARWSGRGPSAFRSFTFTDLRFPGRETKDRQFPDANGTPTGSAPTVHDSMSRRFGAGPSMEVLELEHERLMIDLRKLELDGLFAAAIAACD